MHINLKINWKVIYNKFLKSKYALLLKFIKLIKGAGKGGPRPLRKIFFFRLERPGPTTRRRTEQFSFSWGEPPGNLSGFWEEGAAERETSAGLVWWVFQAPFQSQHTSLGNCNVFVLSKIYIIWFLFCYVWLFCMFCVGDCFNFKLYI